MPAPDVAIVRVPFCHAPPLDSSASVATASATRHVTNVFIEVISFKARFFWLHVSEAPAGTPTRPPPSPLGCCATAIASAPSAASHSVRMPPVSSTLWLDDESSVHGGGGAGMDEVQATTTTVQATFASGLAQKLARRVQKDTGMACVVHASCGVSGEMSLSLLGTDSGGGFAVTAAFGALVFRESLALITECIKKNEAACA